MKYRRLFLLLFSFWTFPPATIAQTTGDAGVGAMLLVDPAAPNALQSVTPSYGANGQIEVKADGAALVLTIRPGECAWPGIVILPRTGKNWDLSNYSHVEVKVTNLGDESVKPILRVDNPRPANGDPNVFNAESVSIPAGASKTLKVFFGYSYGRPAYTLQPDQVSRAMLSTDKVGGKPIKLKLELFQAAGFAGEKPGENPAESRRKPQSGGILLRSAANGETAPDRVARGAGGNGGYAAFNPSLQTFVLHVKGPDSRAMLFPAPAGFWDFSDFTRTLVTVKNVGKTPASPKLLLESNIGPSETFSTPQPLPPGASATIEIPFAASVPWRCDPDPAMLEKEGRVWTRAPGTGTDFRAHKTTALVCLGDHATAATGADFAILELRGATASPDKPSWLGSRPPVPGKWKQTLAENFDDGKLNHKIWNVYWFNWTSPLVHFSKDNIFVENGNLILRITKQKGFQNDDPKDKETPYATGWADTFGKWTQRYGYFEIRCKLPTQKYCWPGFWTMPDRGRGVAKAPGYGVPFADWPGFRTRYSNFDGGMEFDILEAQSIWGPHRFNVACHWGDYGKGHHRLGTSAVYIDTDEEGFLTMGMLWLPGHVSFWEHGRKFWEWNSPRVASVPMMLHLQHMLGGWEFDPLDDRELPADFVIDYIRVWQREDLASPDDGYKPNKGLLDGRYPQWIDPNAPEQP